MALKDKTISSRRKPNEALAAEIRARVKEGTLSCAEAFAAADARGVTPLEVGQEADVLLVPLSHCQLGLFGYPGHDKGWTEAGAGLGLAPDGLEAAIRRKAGREAQVTCPDLWGLAELYGIPRIFVGFLTDRLGIRIKDCQLGAF